MGPKNRRSILKKVVKAVKYIPLVAALAGISYLWLGQREEEETVTEQILSPVRVTKPDYGSLRKDLRLSGHIETESLVTVFPMVSGILEELKVDVGDDVEKGQFIARIDSARYDLQLSQAEAAYLSAKSSYERISQLYESKAVSKQNYEEAKGQYEAYKSQYELAQLQLEYAKIKSPIEGVVITKHLSQGSIAAPERPIVTIGDLSNLIVRVQVPEKYYSFFRQNQQDLKVLVDHSTSEQFSGIIKNISPIISAETKNFEVTVTGTMNSLRPGMYVSVTFVLEELKTAYSLPFQALVSNSYLWYVEEDIAYRIEFTPAFTTDDAFEIPANLHDRLFIIEGQNFLREGQRVRVINADTVKS